MMKALTTRFFSVILMILFASASFAVQVHRDMTNSRLAEVKLDSKLDIRIIQEIGGIFDHYNGRDHRVYLLPEDFEALQMRGFELRWLSEAEIDPTGLRHRPGALDEYHENNDIEAAFITWQAQYPTLFSYESIGLSVNGRNLWVCKLSDSVSIDQPEIEVKYISTMHGDEVVGLENCLRLIDTLLTSYGTDPELTGLLSEYEIFIMPLMNPDGRAAGAIGQRWNANGADLNRNFPDRVDDSTNTTAGREVETAAVMNWCAERNFVVSANYHGGAVVANYPWDNNYTHSDVFSPTPEQDLFHHISYVYSANNETMFNSGSFPPDGTTNGADWYAISGGMQDWNYIWMGCKDVTIEVSDTKSGPESALDSLWDDNRISMIEYLKEAREGVRGSVTDAATGNPLRAQIMLETIPYLTYSSALHGEYYRMLRPGTYSLTYSANGYASETFNNISVVAGTPTILDVQLDRVPAAEIAVEPSPLEQDLEPCTSQDVSMTVYNLGAVPLNWSVQEDDDVLSPDWTAFDGREPGGPTYSWRDISGSGAIVDFNGDDENLGPYPIGFAFPFYGQNFTTFRLSANGYLSFTSSATGEVSWSNRALPDNTRPENMIACWWDDLSPQRTGCIVRRYTNNADSLIITFQGVQSYSGGGLYNFQMILVSSGEIVFQYGSMGTQRLNSATIGVQNADRTLGMTIVYNGNFIADNLALRFCPGNVIEFTPASGTVAAGQSQLITAHLNSCCLTDGLYETAIEFTSNDPFVPVLTVPVTIDVFVPTPPAAVVDLTAVFEGSGIRLNWSAADGAASYDVWRGSSPDFDTDSGSFVGNTETTTFPDNSLNTQPTFYFVIARP